MQNTWTTINCKKCGEPYRMFGTGGSPGFCGPVCRMLYRREKRDRLWLEKKQENKRRKIKRRARKATLQTGTDFYFSLEWRRLRFDVIMERGRVCDACGAAPKNKSRIHVDHIKPRSKYPELELKKENLQILCDDCNIGKGARYEVDFRELN